MNTIETALLAEIKAIPGATDLEERKDGFWMEAEELDVVALCELMIVQGYRMATMSGKPAAGGETAIIYHYAKGGQLLHFRTLSRQGKLPSLADISHPASWCERELHDFFAVKFDGHPNLAPLLRPSDMSEGFFRDNTEQATGNA